MDVQSLNVTTDPKCHKSKLELTASHFHFKSIGMWWRGCGGKWWRWWDSKKAGMQWGFISTVRDERGNPGRVVGRKPSRSESCDGLTNDEEGTALSDDWLHRSRHPSSDFPFPNPHRSFLCVSLSLVPLSELDLLKARDLSWKLHKEKEKPFVLSDGKRFASCISFHHHHHHSSKIQA